MHFRVSLALLFCATALSAQQAPPVTFRAEVNFVEVDAIVTDEQGNLVEDLTPDDFEILEDRKPQAISTFAYVNIPVTRPRQPLFATAPIEPDVQTNDGIDGRVYILVLDSRHTHPLNALRVKEAARQFIETRLGSNDVAAVVHTAGRANLGQDFTNRRSLLVASVERFVGEKLRSSTLQRADAYSRAGGDVEANWAVRSTSPVNVRDRGVMDPDEMERSYNARATLGSLRRLSEFMASIRGRRKAMVFISEGFGYDLSNPWSASGTSFVHDEMREAVGAAARGNVSIYAIDPRGLATGTGDAIELDAFPADSALNIGLGSMQSEARLAQENLRTLAEETGGFAAVNRNDFRDVFERLVRENSGYYVIGYYPTNDKRDGKYRKITVRVKRPGLEVRARRGYAAPRGKVPEAKPDPLNLPPALRDAMNSPIPMAGLPMRVFAGAFKGIAPNASVAVSLEMQASQFRFTESEGVYSNGLTMVLTPIEQNGKVWPGVQTKAKLDFKPDTFEAATANGLRVLLSVDIPPGRYQLRVSATEEGAGQTGSVLYDLEVPDFYEAPLSMSGVALTALSGGQIPTMGSEGIIAPLVAGPTIATREFPKGDEIALFLEVYENQPKVAPHKLELSVTLRGADGRVIFRTAEERSSMELQAGRGGYGYAPVIPLTDVEPGEYVIHVEARSFASNELGIGRDILIRVK